MKSKKAIVVHSGGMDSSLCLALAIKEFGCASVLSLSFRYGQRNSTELSQAAKICSDWGVDHAEVAVDQLALLSHSALTDHSSAIEHSHGKAPNTLVVGRNGLMARLAAIHAHHLGAHTIYMGVLELEEANSGYRDCSRAYMDLKQQILRLDLDDPQFEIRTPLIRMTKVQTMELAEQMGILEYLLEETVTCYEGVRREGCKVCPACLLRNDGVAQFRARY
jgi:7-cyano-7-deazaguanine synthase